MQGYSEKQLASRATHFANNVKNLGRFLTSDVETKKLYGHTKLVLDCKALRSYYEYHEKISSWRDFDSFIAVIEERIETLISKN